MSDRFCERCFPALWVWVVLCCLPGGVVLAQGDVADRIAEQRDRAAEQAAAPATSSGDVASREAEPRATENTTGQRTSSADASGEVAGEISDQGEALPVIPPTVYPEESWSLGANDSPGSAGDGEPLKSPNSGWVMNTLAALGVVIGLILFVRWVARRSGMGSGGGGVRVASSPIVEVLSRTTVAPRNHVVLLRVGARVLVVNDGAAGMRTLATIDDPDEVAGLLQSVQAANESSMSNSFGKVMSKLSGQWSSAEQADELGTDDSEAGVDRARTALSGLRDRLHLSGDSRRGGGA